MPHIPRTPPPPPAGCLWIEEAARYVGLAKNTLYKYRQCGIGPKSFAVGRKVAYEIRELDSYLDGLKNRDAQPSPIAA